MEEKKALELSMDEMNQVSGGKTDDMLSDGLCPGCRRQLEHIEGREYWCVNERCWAYHIRKTLQLIC